MFLRTKQYECVIDISYWFKFLTAFIEPDGNTKMHCVNQVLTESPQLHCPPFYKICFQKQNFFLEISSHEITEIISIKIITCRQHISQLKGYRCQGTQHEDWYRLTLYSAQIFLWQTRTYLLKVNVLVR